MSSHFLPTESLPVSRAIEQGTHRTWDTQHAISAWVRLQMLLGSGQWLSGAGRCKAFGKDGKTLGGVWEVITLKAFVEFVHRLCPGAPAQRVKSVESCFHSAHWTGHLQDCDCHGDWCCILNCTETPLQAGSSSALAHFPTMPARAPSAQRACNHQGWEGRAWKRKETHSLASGVQRKVTIKQNIQGRRIKGS